MIELKPTKLSFVALGSTHPRKHPIRGVVVHWTGGIRPPEGVFDTLRSRKSDEAPNGLSVHYVVGVDGQIFQFAPHNVVCHHASLANEWTVGIEVVSAGFAGTTEHRLELERGVHREKYVDRVRGVDKAMLDFMPEQYEALTALVEHVCEDLKLPKAVPLDSTGALMRRMMSPKERSVYRGVLGHYHVSSKKYDPGTRFLESLRKRWRSAVV